MAISILRKVRPKAGEEPPPSTIRVLPLGAALMALWLGGVLLSLAHEIGVDREHTLEGARIAARSAHQKDMIYRQWNADHGGVYVPLTAGTVANSLFHPSGREIRTPSGKVLTLVNPYYMHRQIREREEKTNGIVSHVTSLHPIRPENAPDPWEKKALLALAAGREEASSVVLLKGAPHLRLMRSLKAEERCFTCHERRGVREGSALGGLSVSIPMAPFLAIQRTNQIGIVARHALFALIGLAGIGCGLIHLRRQIGANLRSRSALEESEERFRSVFSQTGAGMAILGGGGRFLQVNPALCDLLGYGEAEMKKLSAVALTHPEDRPRTNDLLRQARAGGRGSYRYEKRLLHKDGRTVWVDISTTWLTPERGDSYGIALVQDITERTLARVKAREKEERLHHLAHHDPLTSLPNRLLLRDRIDHALARARRSGGKVALLFLDLDRFKAINDSLGHNQGDLLLCAVAGRLRGIVRESDTLARFGGDEFIIALEQAGEVHPVAESILKVLAPPVKLDGQDFYVSASIGISLFPEDGEDAETLIQNADAAMYRAKEEGRNTFQFYQPHMNARTRDLLLLEGELRRALERRELTLFYQPQFDLASGHISGMEALLRWSHPARGLVSPADFIPLAEETGLIIPIGEWVLETACRQARLWQERGLRPVRMAVNISARQFRRNDLARTVARALENSGLSPNLLELEITESMIMQDVEAAIGIMGEIAAMGVALAIDDFGSGYSSLSCLKRFPIHRLKIDRSFLVDLAADPKNAAVAGSIIRLAHSMHLEVVAEGVETEAQKEFLRSQGCSQGQGFLFSHPLPLDEIEPMLLFQNAV